VNTLGIILARAGSKGLPGKNVAPLLGRPMIAYTIEHALAARSLDRVVVSTDGAEIAQVARLMAVEVIDRPAALAGDLATVDAAARHALQAAEAVGGQRYDAVVILYGNVPLRPADLIDRAVAKLESSGADSVQSLCPVGKMHPYWMKKLGGPDGDRIEDYQPNTVYRRQDLPAVYQLDGGIIAVRRQALLTIVPGQPHAFLGQDRRAVITRPGEVVDVDTSADLAVAEALLRQPQELKVVHPPLIVAGCSIDARSPVYVIAELGVNHDGSRHRALELTVAARQTGADAIKLQLFTADHLLSAEARLAQYQQSEADVRAMLRRLQLDDAAMAQVRARARELNIAFIVTCFSLEDVSRVAALDVDAVKVASPDCVNLPLIQALLDLGKPLLISTGAADRQELDPVARLLQARQVPAAFLQCVSCYPTADLDASLAAIRDLPCDFLAGYSDHTTSIHTGGLAVAAGATIIEKHLTYDRAAAGPDHAASLDPQQFQQYVAFIRQAQIMRGSIRKEVLSCEQDVRSVSRLTHCAERALPAGHVLTREDVTIKRPGTGLPAAMLPGVVGRKLLRPVRADHLLHVGDVERN